MKYPDLFPFSWFKGFRPVSNGDLETKSPLRQLADIISSSVDQIDATFKDLGQQYPNLDAPYDPTAPAEATALSPEVIHCSSLIVAACAHLSATVNIPTKLLFDVGGGFHLSAALGVIIEGNVVEILHDHPSGLSVYDISAKNGMDPARLARLLRLLATHHIFIETSPNVFKNNKLSSMLDTHKSFDTIQSKPKDKYVGTSGMSALFAHTCDEVMKGSAFLTETLTDPDTGASGAVEDSPLAVAFKSEKSMWEWYEEPGNEYRMNRFMLAMEGFAKFEPPDAILRGYQWGNLPPQSLVVDVGGSLGHIVREIRNEYPGLKYVVQDRPAVIESARQIWEKATPSISDGSVVLQVHDFLKPQPILNARIFLCRAVIHDYSYSVARLILRNLRDAATENTELLIIDMIAPYACLEDNRAGLGCGIMGIETLPPPTPLLANLGKANAVPYILDSQVLVVLNGEERTIGSFAELLKDSGWKVTRVFTISGSSHKQILAVPV